MKTPAVPDARWWRRGFLASLAVVLLAIGSLAPYTTDSAELVRMRNALVLDDDPTARFDWTPATVPADFALERADPTPAFKARVAAMQLATLPSDWERALHIARHLLAGRTRTVGRPIQSDIERTYSVIMSTGEGYCGDYADVFTALALAAELHVRSWAFSFDGFGGSGHIFNEVWDSGAGKWRMIDPFNNYYMAGPDGEPLSALAFRAMMLSDPDSVSLVPIEPAALPVYKHEAKARLFYARGLHEWYLWWGNGVYTYDSAVLVRTLGGVSRSLEQLGGIAQQVFPRIRVLPDDANRQPVQAMRQLRLHLLAALGVSVLAGLAAVLLAIGWWRAVRLQRRPAA